ncbi:hypothetical protein [Nocardia brasiliensis]|uniref:hypothetical protein n=1 Tax=Nocardia brasiliensis TaxID=37326 RepID=UPI003D903C7C
MDAFTAPVASTSADYDILARVHELPIAHQQLCAARTDLSKARCHPELTIAGLAAALDKYFSCCEELVGLVWTLDVEVDARMLRRPDPSTEIHTEGLGTIIFRMAQLRSETSPHAAARLRALAASYDQLRTQVESGQRGLPTPVQYDHALGGWFGFRGHRALTATEGWAL